MKDVARQMGGEKAVSKQHETGKLTARERVELLCEDFQELGILAHHHSHHPDMRGKKTPADAVITGIGKIHSRYVGVIAYDFTVMAGTMGAVGERKISRLRQMALKEKFPLIWLLDSAGARIQELAGAQFSGTGELFYEQIQLSGHIPQVAAVMGPTAAGTSYIPALADFVPMVKGTSSMALAGPRLVKTAINEDITVEELGGSRIHCEVSGVGDWQAESDEDCIRVIKHFLSFLPSHCDELSPLKNKTTLEVDESILGILPKDPRRTYDMHEVIKRITDTPISEDNGGSLELRPNWARNVITSLARINGHAVGIVANQPKVMGGVLDLDASDKVAKFLWLCDSFHLPVVFLHDCPGFMVGSRMEHMGIIRHGAKWLHAVGSIKVPKLSVVIRRSYGAAYYVMCGRGLRPDLLVGWPSAEIGLMSPEGMVNIIFHKENDKDVLQKKVEEYRQFIGAGSSASMAYLDDVIDPRQTKAILANALDWTRKRIRTGYQHGISPV